MAVPIPVSRVELLISSSTDSFPHDECSSCECFLGYLTQLELDVDGDGKKFLQQYKPAREAMHSCLGCDPCPPGDDYANYLREKQKYSD